MRILVFGASLRESSLNARLATLVARIATEGGADVDFASFREFAMPVFDGDVEQRDGLPAGALELVSRIEASDAIVIAAPEYNFSIAGPLKNAIDWVSRHRPVPFRGRCVLLVSASPGAMGGIRGLWQTRIPLEGLGALVFPDMFALAHARTGFAEDGTLADSGQQERLTRLVTGFLDLTRTIGPIAARTEADQSPVGKVPEALEHQSRLQPASRV